MKAIQVTPSFFVTEQIKVSDLDAVFAQGFKTVINNRPDDEAMFQPKTDEFAVTCSKYPIDYYHVPIISGNYTPDAVKKTRELLDKSVPPILAFCRSGTRSITLWALAHVGILSANEIIATAKNAGYDISGYRSVLERK
jgi:uncharacterized protein (TIGR01244 family)